MWMFGHGYWYGPGLNLSPFLGLGFFLLMLFLVAALIHSRNGSHETEEEGKSEGSESALDILKKRFAKGEITKAEFREMKKEIE